MGDLVRLETSPRAVCGLNKKVVPPQNHSLRNATATTTDVSISFLHDSSLDCVGPTSSTRPTGCRSSRSGQLEDMPEASPDTTLADFVYRKLRRTGWDSAQRPSEIRSTASAIAGEQPLRVEVEIVGKPSATGWSRRKSRPLGSETSNKSRDFARSLGSEALLPNLIVPASWLVGMRGVILRIAPTSPGESPGHDDRPRFPAGSEYRRPGVAHPSRDRTPKPAVVRKNSVRL